MQWIIEHKEWLFSGIAVAIPLAILGWFFSSKKNRQSQKSGNNSTNIQVGGNLEVGKNRDNE